MILADKIVDLRKKNGWSQEELAEKLEVSRQSVSKWEGAQSVPDLNRVLQLSELFGVSTDYLLCRTEDPTDYANPDLLAELAGDQLDALGGDVKKAVALQRATAEDVRREATPKGVQLYEQLDELDRGKAEGYMQGLLSQDKYTVQPAHRKKLA